MASAVASHQHQPASVMARVDRLDLVVGYLEEMRAGNSGRRSCGSPSTTATTASDSGSSVASTPRGSCRPAKEALEEARAKGSLVDRIAFLESRVLKMEEEMEVTSDLRSSGGGIEKQQRCGKAAAEKVKRLKSLVKSCVRGKLKTND
ncbi:hypothetical protein E2562_038027 [Oryza meyeriana var. granulata]|uniref:Uncharacterized protein n=1 Tax=Oryza meyeriana var. granulata TaxID=110450 RepID=A0A6G1ECT8_9ORYZ|nr:hypothetical protein E2562_038027 [Oryza meyeriana var. granulata]